MSLQAKQNLKRAGQIALGTLAIGALATLVGAILLNHETRIEKANADLMTQQAQTLEALNSINVIATFVCSQVKSPRCPIPVK